MIDQAPKPQGHVGQRNPDDWEQRVGPFSKLPRLLLECGVDTESVLRQVDLPPDSLNDPDNRVPYLAALRLLTESVRQTGCEHLALSMGIATHLADLGVLGELIRHCPTVGEALRTLMVYQQLNAQGSAPYMLKEADTVALGYAVYHPKAVNAYLMQEAAMAIVTNIVRELAGYNPDFVLLTLPRLVPTDVAPYKQHFHCPIRFNAPQAELRFSASVMQKRIRGADAKARCRLQEEADHRLASTFETRLYRALSALLMGDMHGMSGNAVAQQLSIHRRTLNRRLEALGTTFQAVLDDIRYNVARQLLRETRLPVSDIAARLGYTESSAFARAFRRWSGYAPHDWRSN